MVGEWCRPSALRPRLGLYHDCFRLCAPRPHSRLWVCPALFNDCAGRSSHYIFGETVGFWQAERSFVCRPSPRHSITPRLTFVKRSAVQTRITREELHIAAQQFLFYHLLVAARVRRVAGLAIWSDLARLHCMCAGTRLSILSLPPAARGITWSAVNANGCAVLWPQ